MGKFTVLGAAAVAAVIGVGIYYLRTSPDTASEHTDAAARLSKGGVPVHSAVPHLSGRDVAQTPQMNAEPAAAQDRYAAQRRENDEKLARMFADHPEYKQAYFGNLRRQVLRSYGDLSELLGIDKQMASRVSNLLVERVLSQRDVAQLTNYSGSQAVHAMFRDSVDAEIKAEIGEEKFARLKIVPGILKYESELKYQYSVDFQSVNEPLTPEETRNLAEIMAQNLNWNNRPMQDGPSDDEQFIMKSEAAVLEAAKQTLTPMQLAALRQRFIDRNTEEFYARKYFPKENSK